MKRKNKNKIKIISIFLVLTILIFSIYTIITYATTETLPIICSDTNLYNKLIEEIPKDYILSKDSSSKTINIKQENLANITSLTLNGAEISNISGIQVLSYLESLDISDNNISDISALNSLAKLQNLNASSNMITNITPISILTNLQALDMSSNRISDMTPITNLTNLTNLNLAQNAISNAKPLAKLVKMKSLDLSKNSSITNIDDTLQESLISLNLSGTGIRKIKQNDSDEKALITQKCQKLEELYLADTNISDISYLFEMTYENEESRPCLLNLKKFDYSNPSGATIDLSNLLPFTNLVEIDLPGNSLYNISPIYDLTKLTKLNLANNNITDLSGLINIEYNEQGEPQVTKKSNVQNLVLEKNSISDISVLTYITSLKQLNLKSNQIYNISPIENLSLSTLNLEKQKINMDIYRKQNTENQYIILLNLFQSAKKSSSIIYDPNAEFELTGVTLNTSMDEYKNEPYYNVIIPIEYDNYEQRDLTVKINNGPADGSILQFNITDSTSAIDSLVFEDQNLDAAIYDYLIKNLQENSYIARAPFIINIEKQQILNVSELDISNHNISNIKGLSNFTYLNTLNIADNTVSDISEIKYLENLKVLYLTNNKLNGNYSAIEKLYYLKTLGLAGNNISSLEGLNKLIKNITDNYYEVQLSSLVLSNNNISDISILEKLSTLENLDISGNNISDISKLKNNTKMKTLNISNNNISDMSVVQKFSDTLNTLNASKNKIENISIIRTLSLTELNLASNSIEDISVLNTQTMLKTLDVSSNKIKDIQSIEALSITKYNFKQQKLTYSLVGEENIETVALPKIFKQSKHTSSKAYSAQEFEKEKCTLTEDSQSVIINKQELNGETAKVIIKGGKADGTTLSLAEPTRATITYSTEEKTDQDVIATIEFNKSGVTITNNDGKNTYTFTENGSFTFQYKDENDFEGSAVATVNWIDKTPPEVILESSKYKINEDEKNISNIEPDTVITAFKSNITNDRAEYKIVDKNNVEKNNENDKIATGDQIITTDGKEFTVCVTGDTNGDGQADLKDIFAINKHRLNTTLLSGVYKNAADVNSDNKIDIKDIFKINKYRLGTITTLNNREEK